MLIRCKQVRKGGTEILMGDMTYQFTPNNDGDHVCDVVDDAHIERFLAIPEGFESCDMPEKSKLRKKAGL